MTHYEIKIGLLRFTPAKKHPDVIRRYWNFHLFEAVLLPKAMMNSRVIPSLQYHSNFKEVDL